MQFLNEIVKLTEKSFRLSNGVEKGPFFPLLRGGGSGGGIEESAFFGGKGGLTVGTIQSSAFKNEKFFRYLHRGHF